MQRAVPVHGNEAERGGREARIRNAGSGLRFTERRRR